MKMQLFLMAYSSAYSERCQEASLSYRPVLSRQGQLDTSLFNLKQIVTGYFGTTYAMSLSDYFISTFILKKKKKKEGCHVVSWVFGSIYKQITDSQG